MSQHFLSTGIFANGDLESQSRQSRSPAQALRNMLVCYRAALGGSSKTSSTQRASQGSTSPLGQAGSSFIFWVCYRAALASTSKSSSNPGAKNASRTSLGTLATRVCYRATLASTCKTSSNPRASNASTPRRGHAAWSVICSVCYRATLAGFSCCSPSANPRAGKAR